MSSSVNGSLHQVFLFLPIRQVEPSATATYFARSEAYRILCGNFEYDLDIEGLVLTDEVFKNSRSRSL